MSDLLGNSFTEEINVDLLKKNFQLQKLALAGMFLYAILSNLYWVNVFLQQYNIESQVPLNWFIKTYPLIIFSINILSVVNYILSFRSHKMIYAAFKNKDASLFNEGYNSFYNSTVIAIIILAISIVTLVIHLLIM